MAAVFAKLVGISLSASCLILAVLLARLLLKKASRQTVCLLWAVVALRLLLPFSLESPVSLVPQAIPKMQLVVDTTLIHPQTAPISGVAAQAMPEQSLSLARLAPAIWAVGMAIALVYLLVSILRLHRLVAEGIPDGGNVWICDAVASPFILGIVRPRIYLPSGLPQPQRAYVLAHEESHLKWKDHWWKLLAYVLLAVYWFNPLVWAAYIMVCRDLEFACDERVVRTYTQEEKKAYAKALLACSSQKRLVLVCPVAFGENAVVQRVRNIMHYKKPGFWILLVCVVVIVVAAVGFLTVPSQEPDQTVPTLTATDPTLPPETTPPVPETAPTVETTPSVPKYTDTLTWETVTGETYHGTLLIISDPSRVYLATSSPEFSKKIPGERLDDMMEREQAAAGINGGLFYDDGTASAAVGSVPEGLTISGGQVLWEEGPQQGFAGFNQDHILIVSDDMTPEKAQEAGIQDGCTAGPVLMVNGVPNPALESLEGGYQARTVLGQRADGAVLMLFINGRQPDSIGADYSDLVEILTRYEAVNACCMAGGMSSNMFVQDESGLHSFTTSPKEGGPIPRKMPTFWMVKPA